MDSASLAWAMKLIEVPTSAEICWDCSLNLVCLSITWPPPLPLSPFFGPDGMCKGKDGCVNFEPREGCVNFEPSGKNFIPPPLCTNPYTPRRVFSELLGLSFSRRGS